MIKSREEYNKMLGLRPDQRYDEEAVAEAVEAFCKGQNKRNREFMDRAWAGLSAQAQGMG